LKQLNMELVADMPFKSGIAPAEVDAMARKLITSGAQVVINHGGVGVYEQLIRAVRKQDSRMDFRAVNSGSAQLLGSLEGFMTAKALVAALKTGGPEAHAGELVFAQVEKGLLGEARANTC
jgi:hypothetical protein